MSEFKCSATFKRAEQLKRWEESETNQRSPEPKGSSRIRFSVDCVFLAACAAGDKDEVLRLVQSGADVNTPSADGLTALHQACIDDKLDMVEYLIKLGADVNHSDNEGWTPLHATASCGFVSIARFLLSHDANLSAVNNEGELPVDIAEAGPMKNFLHDEIQKQGIDCEKARSEEERLLSELSKRWYITKSLDAEIADEKTGATPLHVAAAKGYIKVMNILLGSCGVDVDPIDFDGWTPLHASAHWGQQEAASILVQYGADMDIKNYVGQTCFDVAALGMKDHLEDLKNRHDTLAMALYNKKRRPTGPDDLPIKHKKLDLQIENKAENNIIKKTVEKKNAVNTNSHSAPPSEGKPPKVGGAVPPSAGPLSPSESPPTDDEPSWRHSSRQKASHLTTITATTEKECPSSPPSSDNEIILRRTQSCEIDKLSPQQDKKKEITQPLNPSPARSSLENVNEQNDIATKALPAEPTPSKISPGNIFKNFFKSFVPPVRDEESETQRKAHAKRVRETRRSTQGVTLDEIKSAEQLVKKKNNNLIIVKTESEPVSKRDSTLSTDTETNQKETVSLEDSRAGDNATDTNTEAENETTVTIALPRASQLPPPKKEEEKDADTRGATQAAQNVIQRRRRPKRRSTGVVNVDLDEITPDQATNDGAESGSESTEQSSFERSTPNKDEPSKIDYKALWEASQLEIKQLKEMILANERELEEARHSIEKYTNVITSVSENEKREKRERRATERKMSEMEEELKQLQKLKAENERLKAENRALTRVVSKLTNSTGK